MSTLPEGDYENSGIFNDGEDDEIENENLVDDYNSLVIHRAFVRDEITDYQGDVDSRTPIFPSDWLHEDTRRR
jgi:hypothetical protein